MVPFFDAISAIGMSLEALLVWRLFDRHLVRRYPFFSAFVFYDLVRALLDFVCAHLSWPFFGRLYWTSETIEDCLLFLIVWEVFRSLFIQKSVLPHLAEKTLLAVSSLALPLGALLCWSQTSLIHPANHFIPSIFEQYMNLTQSLLLLAIAGLARYYRVPLGRNLRGLVFGSGFFLLLNSMVFAATELLIGLLPDWQLLPSLMYISVTAFWLWSFWDYAPSGARTAVEIEDLQAADKWNIVRAAATRSVRRGQD